MNDLLCACDESRVFSRLCSIMVSAATSIVNDALRRPLKTCAMHVQHMPNDPNVQGHFEDGAEGFECSCSGPFVRLEIRYTNYLKPTVDKFYDIVLSIR